MDINREEFEKRVEERMNKILDMLKDADMLKLADRCVTGAALELITRNIKEHVVRNILTDAQARADEAPNN